MGAAEPGLPLAFVLIPLVLLLTVGGLFLLSRIYRRKSLQGLDRLRLDWRRFDANYSQVVAVAREYLEDAQEPFLTLNRNLQAALERLEAIAAPLRGRRVALRQRANDLGKNPWRAVIGAPYLWYLLYRDLQKLERAMDQAWSALEAALGVEQDLAEIGWKTAQSARAALGLQRQADELLGRLRAQKLTGDALDQASGVLRQAAGELHALPAYIYEADEQAVLDQAAHDEIVQVHAAVANARPALEDLIRRAHDWQRQAQAASVNVEGLRKALNELQQTLDNLPKPVDAEPARRQLDGMEQAARTMEATLTRLEVDSAALLAEQALRAARSAQELTGQLRRARRDLASLETVLEELPPGFKDLSLRMAALGGKSIQPLQLSPSLEALAALNRQANRLGSAGRKRTPEAILDDQAAAAGIRARQKELSAHLQELEVAHAELTSLLTSPPLNELPAWLARARRLTGEANAYAVENWSRGDAPSDLPAELDALAQAAAAVGVLSGAASSGGAPVDPSGAPVDPSGAPVDPSGGGTGVPFTGSPAPSGRSQPGGGETGPGSVGPVGGAHAPAGPAASSAFPTGGPSTAGRHPGGRRTGSGRVAPGASSGAPGLPEDALPERLEQARRLAGETTRLDRRLENIRIRLEDLRSAESAARELLENAARRLGQFEFIVRSNSLLSSLAMAELDQLRSQLNGLLDELGRRGESAVDRKARQAGQVVARLEAAANNWLEQLQVGAREQVGEISSILQMLGQIAPLEESAVDKAQQLLEDAPANQAAGRSGRGRYPLDELPARLRQSGEYWEACTAALNALEDFQPLIDTYQTANQRRGEARTALSEATTWLRRKRAWPPTTVSLDAERQEMERVEAEWQKLRESSTRAIARTAQLGGLAARYQALADRIGQAVERSAREEEEVLALEQQVDDLASTWQDLYQRHAENVTAAGEIEGMLASITQEHEALKRRYIAGTLTFQAAVDALKGLQRQLRYFQAKMDEGRALDIRGNIIRTVDSRRDRFMG
ncbi:MAG: hypothetical protein ACKOC5_14070 [Chloroflexota bacterium]